MYISKGNLIVREVIYYYCLLAIPRTLENVRFRQLQLHSSSSEVKLDLESDWNARETHRPCRADCRPGLRSQDGGRVFAQGHEELA